MRALWAEDRVNFEGEYYSTHDASIYDRPEGGVPIYIAAGGPDGRAVRRPRGRRLHLHVRQGRGAVHRAAHPRRAARALEADGRVVRRVDRMIEIKLSYEDTEEAALENTRFWSPLSLSKEQKHDITDPVEMERAADALPIEQIATRWIVGTDPDAVVAQIGQYVDVGLQPPRLPRPGPRPAAVPRAVRARPGAAPAGAVAGARGARTPCGGDRRERRRDPVIPSSARGVLLRSGPRGRSARLVRRIDHQPGSSAAAHGLGRRGHQPVGVDLDGRHRSDLGRRW